MACLAPPTDSIENPTLDDLIRVLADVRDNDEEHAAFWYVSDDEDLVLEVHGDRSGFLLLEQGARDFKYRFADWMEVEHTFRELLTGRQELVKELFGVTA
ncbi:MAG: hypothetical protein EOO12_04940 [Chitinophagaceae bacterium]|nr:MAG: hypothetical protein EOO12_04940 [Chitinophagaceae bacterium]